MTHVNSRCTDFLVKIIEYLHFLNSTYLYKEKSYISLKSIRPFYNGDRAIIPCKELCKKLYV